MPSRARPREPTGRQLPGTPRGYWHQVCAVPGIGVEPSRATSGRGPVDRGRPPWSRPRPEPVDHVTRRAKTRCRRTRLRHRRVARALTYRSGVADDGLDRLFSADSHVVEPPNLFVTRVPRSAVARAPRLVDEGTYQRWEFPGSDLTVRLGLVGSAGKDAADVDVEPRKRRWRTERQWDTSLVGDRPPAQNRVSEHEIPRRVHCPRSGHHRIPDRSAIIAAQFPSTVNETS